jgi:hypothetical protein
MTTTVIPEPGEQRSDFAMEWSAIQIIEVESQPIQPEIFAEAHWHWRFKANRQWHTNPIVWNGYVTSYWQVRHGPNSPSLGTNI